MENVRLLLEYNKRKKSFILLYLNCITFFVEIFSRLICITFYLLLLSLQKNKTRDKNQFTPFFFWLEKCSI